MIKFLEENLRYPPEALDKKIEGEVEVIFVVNGLGKVIEAKVTKGIGYGCDEEALRLVGSLVFEKVYNRGLNTRTNRSLKIRFRLPKPKKTTVNYQIVKDTPPNVKPTSNTYTITIKLPDKK